MAYLLDTNVSHRSQEHYYGFEFCPAFWDWLDVAGASWRRCTASSAVYDELVDRDDDLSDWARDDAGVLPAAGRGRRPSGGNGQPVGERLGRTTTLAAKARVRRRSRLVPRRAGARRPVTPSSRTSASVDGRKRIKIPNAASAHGVPWCTPFHMLRVERAPRSCWGRCRSRGCRRRTSSCRSCWNFCNVLRDDGVSTIEYVEQLTYLLFLKMADERQKAGLGEVVPLRPRLAVAARPRRRRPGGALPAHPRVARAAAGNARARSSARRRTASRTRPSSGA